LRYVTSIWSINCTGHLTASIPTTPFTFIISNSTDQLYVSELRTLASPLSRIKRKTEISPVYREVVNLLLMSSQYMLESESRCPNPYSIPIVAPGARPPRKTDCRSSGWGDYLVSDLQFTDCCRGHSYCYG